MVALNHGQRQSTRSRLVDPQPQGTAEASVSSFAQGCSAPIQGENLELDRVTVGFNQSTGERFVLEDRWTAAVRDPQKDQWNGWTFFRVKSFNVPGGNGDDHPDRVRGDPSEHVGGDPPEQV